MTALQSPIPGRFTHLDNALTIYQELPNCLGKANTLYHLAELSLEEGEPQTASGLAPTARLIYVDLLSHHDAVLFRITGETRSADRRPWAQRLGGSRHTTRSQRELGSQVHQEQAQNVLTLEHLVVDRDGTPEIVAGRFLDERLVACSR